MSGSNSKTNKNSRLLKVVLLGDGGVGKSSLMHRFVSNKFETLSFYTIGVEFRNKDIIVNGETFTLQIWDTAGQERFKSLRTPFYRGADCCLLTFGVDDMVSLKNLSFWKKEFLYNADVQEADLFPFVVLGNKVDIAEQEVAEEEAIAWCAANHVPYYQTSAKDAINVDTAFHAAVERVIEQERSLDNSAVDLSKKATRSGCC
ncbi:hypothetical protein CAPTEDRAFT_127231 [Capitella teleta]|uniref:small monomeric GTPase n=1 Tax=Capitella teleta TaxID=283909 RepID=R7US46_CAPTE|nr:hypothetical protein CAPTEDRAFT_127231 [Capitella teleta]|eukprot:ELU08963.1 hypothetical protein CAPTEDRAFT_127231 [Capitella teleta]